MSREIINEIVRIQEIMLGLNTNPIRIKKYLTEQAIMDDIAEDILKMFDNKTDDLFRNVSDEVLEDIIFSLKSKFAGNKIIKNIENIRVLKNVFESLEDVEKQFIAKLIIKNSKGSLDNSLAIEVSRKLSSTIDELIEVAKTYSNVQKFLSDLEIPDYLQPALRRFYNKVNKVQNILKPSEITKLANAIKNKGVTYFNSDLIKALRNSTDDIVDNIEKLNSEYLNKINSGQYNSDEITELTNGYSVQIGRELNILEMKMNNGAINALENINLDTKILDKLKNGTDDVFTVFRKIQKTDPTGVWGEIMDTANQFWQSIIPRFDKEMTILGKKIKIIRFNMPSEFKQFLLTGQWAKFSSFYTEAVKMSAFGSKTMQIGSKTFKIPNIYKYIIKMLVKSYVGGIIGLAIYSIVNTLLIQLKIKLGVNKVANFCHLREPYPNAKDEFIQGKTAIGGLIPQLINQVWGSINKFEANIPILGTFNHSLAANLLAYITGTESAGFSLSGIMEVINNTADKELSSDEEPEIKEEINNTPTPAPNNDVKIMNDFKNYIITTWGGDYKEGNVEFSKEGEYYVVSDKSVNMKYLYKYNNNTFEYVEQ